MSDIGSHASWPVDSVGVAFFSSDAPSLGRGLKSGSFFSMWKILSFFVSPEKKNCSFLFFIGIQLIASKFCLKSFPLILILSIQGNRQGGI
jgi:hypothetical protein